MRPLHLSQHAKQTLLSIEPATPNQLHTFIRGAFNLDIPRTTITPNTSAPFDYLIHTFFEHRTIPRDCVVWASRGSGKTFLAALATALDLAFKPGIEIKLLAGSLEQAQRMHTHLRNFLTTEPFSQLLESKPTTRRIALNNGSACELLAQSETSVRGARPQILRCDEVELFDRQVHEAATLTTRSKRCGRHTVQGAVESLSTMHRPFGLMADLVSRAQNETDLTLFRWSALDILEQCPPERPCATCPLEEDCKGEAKSATGHLAIDDAIQLKSRCAQTTWVSEMLCLRPTRDDLVYPTFNPEIHVGSFEAPERGEHLAAIDFGFRNPTAILFAHLDEQNILRILDERIESERTLEHHINTIKEAQWPTPRWIAIDPAGAQRSLLTGQSAQSELNRAGLAPFPARASIAQGIRAIQRRLSPALGTPTLFIHQRCEELIRALSVYHYDPDNTDDPNPVKDGPDHAADALRYLITTTDVINTFKVHDYLHPHH